MSTFGETNSLSSEGINNVRKASYSPNGVQKSSPNCANSPSQALSKPGTAKKLMIKNFEKPDLPDNYLDETWSKLKLAGVAIQTSKPISMPLEELYKAVENICSHKMATQLYSNLESLCEFHVKSNLDQFIDFNMDSLSFLKLLDKCWQDHCRQMVMSILQIKSNL